MIYLAQNRRLETPRPLTLDEAKDIAAVISVAGDCTPHDDLMSLAQYVSMLDADPVQALEESRKAYLVIAHRLAAVTAELEALRRSSVAESSARSEWDAQDTVAVRRPRMAGAR